MMPPFIVELELGGMPVVYGPRPAWKCRDGGINCTTTSTYVLNKQLLGIILW
jgi:hypothetical protein